MNRASSIKICVIGAGAIGGMLAVKLGLAGHTVSVVLRGANLQAVQAEGLRSEERRVGKECVP